MKTFYIKFTGYCDAVLNVVKVEAETYEEAEKKAIEEYLSEIEISSIDKEEYDELRDDEDDDEGDYGVCPYCGSENTSVIDEVNDELKCKCYSCGEDYLFDLETGEYSDRHRRKITKEVK